VNKIINAALEARSMALGTGMYFVHEIVSPAMALAMLAGNVGNRQIRRAVVAQMAQDMRNGAWVLTHQGVAFAPDGRLLDGQHRLHAVVAAGVSVPMTVARNVPPDTFALMDGGGVSAGKRALRDILAVDGRILDPCSFLTRMHMGARGGRYVSTGLVQEVLEHVGPHLTRLVAAHGACAPRRSAAPIKAAAALRMMQGHSEHAAAQYGALIALDYAAMTPSVQALCRQITDRTQRYAPGSSLQADRAARAWIAFDPARAGITRIQVNDIASCLSEMRAVWAPSWAAKARTP
jgi:hypothetical protein